MTATTELVPTRCPSCGADVDEALHSAPGFAGVAYPTCSDGCGWVGQP